MNQTVFNSDTPGPSMGTAPATTLNLREALHRLTDGEPEIIN